MPKRTRPSLKRSLAQACFHMDLSMESLLELEALFRPHHPDMADKLDAMSQIILATQGLALQFWEEAWGSRPEDYNVYR